MTYFTTFLRARSLLAGLFMITAFSGCAGQMQFERLTGPLSPMGIAITASGGLREQLFPGSQKAFQLCMEDPRACANVGGIKVQITPSGATTLANLKAMWALMAAETTESVEFGKACETLSRAIHAEPGKEAYEVSMRLLAFFNSDADSPLQCSVAWLDQLHGRALETRLLDEELAKLTAYSTGVLAGYATFRARKLVPKSRLARLGLRSSGLGLSALSAREAGRELRLDAWFESSGELYFVGPLSWKRKYTLPSSLMEDFRLVLEEFMPVRALSEEFTDTLRP